MPKVDNSILSKRDQIISEVEKIVIQKMFYLILTRLNLMKQMLLAAYKQVPLWWFCLRQLKK